MCTVALAALCSLSHSAAAADDIGRDATQADWRTCEGDEPAASDQRIWSCTRLLAAGFLPPADRARVLAGRAEAAGSSDMALADISEAIRLDPSRDSYFRLRAQLRQERRDLQGAIADDGEILKRHPDDLPTLRARAMALMATGRYTEAVGDFDVLVKTRPEDGLAYRQRGVARWQSLSFAANSPATGQDAGFAFLQRAACREIQSDCPDVKLVFADLARAIDLLAGRDRAGALAARAQILAQRNDTSGALADFDEAVRLEPDDASLLGARATIRARTGDLAGARADLDGAVRLEPQNPRYFAERADLRSRMGDVDGARGDLDEAFRLPAERDNSGWFDAAVKLRRALARPGEAGMGAELKDLKIAEVSPSHEASGTESITIRLDAEAARQFETFTRMHVGLVTQLVVDGEVVAQPRIMSPIPGGSLTISGRFSHEEIEKLVAKLAGPGTTMTVRVVP